MRKKADGHDWLERIPDSTQAAETSVAPVELIELLQQRTENAAR
ncbi:MAG TPA: hypothetical protein VHT50_12225 [Mycobacterium sp.]|jgi:hypothetical protein|nr:hypothetical protein [Mycobacterium sp.]